MIGPILHTPAARKTRARTMASELARAFDRAAAVGGKTDFARFRDDPTGFCREAIGFEPWEGQRRVMEAVAAVKDVSVPAGRAVGKSRLDAALALWFACTRPGSRVICTAPKFEQVQQIVWEEIRNLVLRSRVPLGIEVAKLASTGARTFDGSQILGWTSERPERFQGVRGAEMLTIADEASGILDEIFHTIDGNSAGNGKLVLTGNPTKTRGYFRDSFAKADSRFTTVRLPSTASPNVIAGYVVVQGLATREWVEEKKQEWGEDSPLYRVHVLGEVAENEEGRLFSVEMLAAAEARYKETPATGRLVIGIDPAGQGGDGDESAFAARRGKKIIAIHSRRGLTEDAHIVEALGLIAIHRGDSREKPLVVIDREGYVGARVWAAFSAYHMQHVDVFDLIGVRSSERAKRKALTYDRVRDEMWFSLVDAFRDGLAVPEDPKLAGDLSAIKAETNTAGRAKITSKDDLRRELGRSPDRGDAVCLACVDVSEWRYHPVQAASPVPEESRAIGLDPYAAMQAWRS